MSFPKDLLGIADLTGPQFLNLLKTAQILKKELGKKGKNQPLLHNKTLVMIFEKPSLRTRVSFETGMTQLGGHAIYLAPADIQLGVRETIADVAGTLEKMTDGIMARVFKHETLLELSKNTKKVPIINGLSDLEHPCQILADMLTILEEKGRLKGISLAFVGDGENNVTHSLALASGILGIDFRVASPKGFKMLPQVSEQAKILAKKSKGQITELENPKEAVENADVIYTDTWISMGDEKTRKKRLKIFKPYQVTQALMKLAKKGAIFMHDMPVYRGNEVESAVIDGPKSVIFDQAGNRLHAQKAVLAILMK
ncbi:MAG: ornithine carbamoyltransferase [Candidatus Levybacteria bacterium]|nr:ornithine carbamoyltransferase [Candidatus Levybacteria bacterium]